MSPEWPVTEIGTIARSVSDTHKMDKQHLVFLNTSDILLGKFLHHDYSAVKDWPGQAKKSIRRDDILYSEIRPANGRWAYVDFDSDDYVVSTKLMVIRADKEKLHPKFLYQYLTSPTTARWLQHLAESRSGTFPQITFTQIASLEIPLPPLEEQCAIAETLGVLDGRIDNLRQTNATLQAIAAALFKSWFVGFDGVPPEDMQESELGLIPKGWRVGTLGECCENIRKQAHPDTLPTGTPYIGLEHMPRKSIALAEWGVSDGLASGKFWYQRNDILFGKLRPYFHKVSVASHEGVCSTDILVVCAKPNWFGFAAMHLFSETMISYATQLSNGAKMPRTNWSDIAGYKVALPPLEVTAEFDGVVRPLVERMHANIEATATLAALRDTLLPRLISGQLRVGRSVLELSTESCA